MEELSNALQVPLPPSLPPSPTTASSTLPPTASVSTPPSVLSAWEMAMDKQANNPGEIAEVDLGLHFGLRSENSIKLVLMPPGSRLHPPVAHSLQDTMITCISGMGLVWQNGNTYPFMAGDSGGWKAGTGISYTILNDGGPGSGDLGLLVVQDRRHAKTDRSHFPIPSDRDPSLPDSALWIDDVPPQNALGRHPGIVSISADGTEVDVPNVKQGTRPSNIANGPSMLEGVGTGEFYCEATSLTQDTGLSGKTFGVNFEIAPPGTRSSDAHAHSLEDELVVVLGGEGLAWINGHTQPVSTGDVIGFPAGTGDAHVFINDSNSEDALAGQDLAMWIWGENKRKTGDRVFYPLLPDRVHENKWTDWPKRELGPHPGRPSHPAGLL